MNASFRDRYEVPDDTIVVGVRELPSATSAVLERKTRGLHTAVHFLLPYRRNIAAQLLSEAIVANNPDWSNRLPLFDALAAETLQVNGQAQQLIGRPSPTEIQLIHSTAACADVCVFGSWTEVAYFAEMVGRRPARVRIEPFRDRWVPAAAAAETPKYVAIWAPDKRAEQIAVVFAALHDEPVKVIAVCAGGAPPAANAEAYSTEAAAGVLASASVIVDYSAYGAGSALALAALGRPLAVASTSGAQEHIGGVAVFDPWSRRSVARAVQIAQTGVPTLLPAGPSASPARTERIKEQHKVSVIVPTLNTSGLLERAVRSVAAQTYRNVEVVITNDGGPPVDLPSGLGVNVKVVSHERSKGLPAARNTAIRNASGNYVAFLDDDDAYLPEHLSNAVRLLDRGAQFTYADYVLCFIEQDADGTFVIRAALAIENQPQPEDFLVSNQIGVLTTVLDRRLFDAEMFDETLPVCEDYDLWVRLVQQRVAFRHTGKLSSLYTVRLDKKNMSSTRHDKFVPTYELIHSRHPMQSRPAIMEQRGRVLDAWRAAGGPPDLTLPQLTGQPMPLEQFDGSFKAVAAC